MPSLSNITSPIFLLTGIPGLEVFHIWFSIPYFCLCSVALLGNFMIMYVVITEQSLHEPMYYFLSMLSATDVGITVSSLPTTLGVLWFNIREISLDGCIVQLFFLHGFTLMESSVLLAMAFDRFVAICEPLRYTTILTNSRIVKAALGIFIRMLINLMPLLLLLKRLSFCGTNSLSHSYCYHPDVIKQSCSSTKINSIVGLLALILTSGIDIPCIILSYVLIIKSLLSIASPEERHKAFSTCISHIGAVAIFYIPWIILALMHRFGHNAPPYIHVLLSNIHFLLPPVLNPIIYSVKTKQIYRVILKVFQANASRV
ncbi:olfactory receptor 51F1-like [Monodelphis domestica]|uniref:olfactory receptor 51F1-like n=1 Tax=Monodelphis domestica TaxID=13616 RepID=UPI0024E20CEB|nr:olfactory receptor 51F1-like [Monodelphis domestica]